MISARKEYAIGQLLKNANDLEIKGKIPEAMDEVRKAIDLNPEDGNLYNRLGDLYLKIGKRDESMDNFRKGVEAFRRDNFLRNALALSKKILRHEPDGFDMYFTIADILVELGEKQDAAQYMFEYIDKQTEQNRTKEALNAIDYLRGLDVKDDKIEERILDYYNDVSKGDTSKAPKIEKSTKKPEPAEMKIPDSHRAETSAVGVKMGRKEIPVKVIDHTETLKRDVSQLGSSVKNIEEAFAGLREAVRFDEVGLSLEKSLATLSAEQRKAIADMQQSMKDNMDDISRSLKELRQSSDKNMEELHGTLDKLNRALASLSKNQASIAQQLSSNLTDLSVHLRSLGDQSAKAIKSVQEEYKRATEEMCCRLDDTKDANSKLVICSNEMKQELGKMSDQLSKYIIAQASKEKKRDRYMMIILIVISVIAGLFVVSLFLR
ncbi:MAG: hypothetical protein JSU64_04390 [candidate division WOR-3 bacterium]|nr:MAG: hypothetical protein JSU64_04390 [candidate division WOR-3 bacterium]